MSLNLVVAAQAQQAKDASYFCTAVAVGGLRYDKMQEKWIGVPFDATDKFVLRLKFLRERKYSQGGLELTDYIYAVTITPAGTSATSVCKSQTPTMEVAVGSNFAKVFCEIPIYQYYIIDLRANRYLKTYAYGYYEGEGLDDISDTPYVEAGTCTKID